MFGFGAALLVVILPITAILLAGARPPVRAPLPSFGATCSPLSDRLSVVK